MSQLTSTSPDTQKRFLPFLNVSTKRVPPFGAMQIVGNPKSYQEAIRDPSLDEVGKSFAKIQFLGDVGQFDRGMQLYCDQIGIAGEFLQNPALIAFNSDSPVDAGGSGRCFLAEYPVRGLCQQHPSWNYSYAVRRGCWHLISMVGTYGAFRSSFRTGQAVSIDIPDLGSTSSSTAQGTRKASAMVLGLIPVDRTPWMPTIESLWRVDGQGEFPITSTQYNSVASLQSEAPFFDDVAFGQSETLTLRLPGLYAIYLEGVLKVKSSAPSAALRIPYRISVAPGSRADESRLDFGSYSPLSLAILRTQRSSAGEPWYQISSMPTSGELLWSRHRYSSMLQVRVIRAPAKIVIKQDQSPFIESVGTSKLVSIFVTESALNYAGAPVWNTTAWRGIGDIAWVGNYSSFGLAGRPVFEFDPGSVFQQSWTHGIAFNDVSDGVLSV